MTRQTLGKVFFNVALVSVLIIILATNVYPAEFAGQERVVFGFAVMIASVGAIALFFGMTYRLAIVAASIGAAAYFYYSLGDGTTLDWHNLAPF